MGIGAGTECNRGDQMGGNQGILTEGRAGGGGDSPRGKGARQFDGVRPKNAGVAAKSVRLS